MSLLEPMNSSARSLPQQALLSIPALTEARRQIRARIAELELEEVRLNADAIRARCESFAGFVKEAWHVLEPENPLIWNWHLQALCDHLEAITRGTMHPRLIINISPGSSKSMFVSVMWQAWEWGPLASPGKRYVSAAYETSLSHRDSRKTRDLILSDWYQALWPLELARKADDSFSNRSFGTRDAVAFSAITGKRGDRFTIDDPHSLDGAESEVEREKAVRRFVEGGQNRVNDQEKSAIVIVMQRLHEADLTGAIVARELGYVHLMIPMEFEPERACVTHLKDGSEFWRDPRTEDGELMDPVRMPPHVVSNLKKDNDYMWAGQYQQRPAPREGGMFKVDNIQIVDFVPAGAIHVRGWDIAGSSRKKAPFTVGLRLAYKAPLVYIVDIRRERVEIDKAEALIVDTAHEDGRNVQQSMPQDPGQAGKAQRMHLSNQLAGLDFHFSTETGEKADRAIPFASMVNAGNVRMVKAKWNGAFIDEARNFPGSTFKDQIDAASRAFERLARHMAPKSGPGIGAPIYPE